MGRPDRSSSAGDASAPSRHPPEQDLARYIDALLAKRTETLPGGLAAHVEDCPHCQEQILDVFFFLRDPLRTPDASLTRRTFPARRSRVGWLFPLGGIAAAAIVFALMMTFVVSQPRHGARDPLAADRTVAPPPPDIVDHSLRVPEPDGVQEAEAEGDLPPPGTQVQEEFRDTSERRKAFAIDPNLESMVGSRTRGFVISVYSPPNHVTLGEEILFQWQEFTREPLSLTIVNNRNETIWQNPVGGGALRFHAPLPSGCYYWKLESASELFYVGKFFINPGPHSPKE